MNKEKLLTQARTYVSKLCLAIKKACAKKAESIKVSKENFKTLRNTDRIIESRLIKHSEIRLGEMRQLQGSPFFVRCDVRYEGEKETKRLYFGKFNYDDAAIYSWVAPASAIRFEKPGAVCYFRPDGKKQKATLIRKDQYMIVKGEIKFLSTENLEQSRELVYQEHFSNRKSGFILPEIVAQMEKAQDQVIRAHHVGPFLIAGPAGSGKTTLALHRVAYLLQSPDLAKSFSSGSMLVLVQDTGTKEYFSRLLPELGIDDVSITTFSEWAGAILNINFCCVTGYGDSEQEKDAFEYAKIKALRTLPTNSIAGTDFSVLAKVYERFFNSSQKKLFQRQLKERVLDRFDLCLMLRSFMNKKGCLGLVREDYIVLENKSVRKEKNFYPLEYSLVVVDEFQNYLPEQLRIIKSCAHKRNQSILYVGDMAQQVQLGTIRKWEDIAEEIHSERKVVLNKIYRNTKNILRYIQKLGYPVEVPDELGEGFEVVEKIFSVPSDEAEYIKNSIHNKEFSSVGVLSKDESYLTGFRDAFANDERVHVMTMNEAQGVEFDAVFLVGINKTILNPLFEEDAPLEFVEEKKRINRDLLYVALTRAIAELHVLGRESLMNLMKKD